MHRSMLRRGTTCATLLASSSMSARRKVEQARSRLEDAFNKSKSVFLEEASSILKSTIEPSTGTSAVTRRLARRVTRQVSDGVSLFISFAF